MGSRASGGLAAGESWSTHERAARQARNGRGAGGDRDGDRGLRGLGSTGLGSGLPSSPSRWTRDRSRPLRIEFPGAVYHVTSRGDRREAIYRDDVDREAQLVVLAQACERFGADLLAYCQMGNQMGNH